MNPPAFFDKPDKQLLIPHKSVLGSYALLSFARNRKL